MKSELKLERNSEYWITEKIFRIFHIWKVNKIAHKIITLYNLEKSTSIELGL